MRALVRWRWGPGGGVVEVEAAGSVEGFFGGAGGCAVGEPGVLVVVVGGSPDRETPAGGVAGVAKPAELDRVAAGKDSVDVGQVAAVAGCDALDLWPTAACPVRQLPGERPFGRVGDRGHGHHLSSHSSRRVLTGHGKPWWWAGV